MILTVTCSDHDSVDVSEQILGLVGDELHACLFDQCFVGRIVCTERTDHTHIVKFALIIFVNAVEHLGKCHGMGVFRT